MNDVAEPAAARPPVTVAGVRWTDLSAVVGATLWAGAVLTGRLTTIERAIALAPLVLVPLGLGLVVDSGFTGLAGRAASAGIIGQPVGAVLLLGSLLVPTGKTAAFAASAWLPVTGLLALAGLFRIRRRGMRRFDLPATLRDAGLVYLPVAAVALVMFHLGITLWFEPVIVLLTAVHFHYAGFVLPVIAGLTGEFLGSGGWLYRAVGSVVLVGPALVAVGISFSPLVEIAAVGAFTLAVATFGALVAVRVVPRCGPAPALLVLASAAALPVSMLLALGYGLGVATGTTLGLDIGTMVSLHGSLNAYGFALCGLLGWRFGPPIGRRD